MNPREFLKDNIAFIITVIDNHDAGIYPNDTYVCPCGFRGREEEWQLHIAEVIATKMDAAEQLQETLL